MHQVHNVAAPRLLLAAFKEEEYRNPQLDFTGITQRAHQDFGDRLRARIDVMLRQAIDKDVAKKKAPVQRPAGSGYVIPNFLGRLLD